MLPLSLPFRFQPLGCLASAFIVQSNPLQPRPLDVESERAGSPITRLRFMSAHDDGPSRRDLFRLTGALAAGTISGQNRIMAAEPESPQIGILIATTYTTGTLESRLDAVKAQGLA